ncbi:glutaredoxin family protein [Halomonas sp. ML-15]|uniref:glutaredoxin family protein n=1 Tax=Halomonas sp. ML-15 TaxID=2773305 RepID=UPI0017463721|nr:glutaredoxin family protein [Halomonas sp. ML-15]MBD3895822.1 glutaredoxin family protein [Halomonas sp. ML-15]
MIRLRLYTTLGCHLCSQLEALLTELSREPVTLEHIEISEDDALMARYGVRIPVLADDQGEELDRGFDPARLAAWLEARGWLDAGAWEALQRQLYGQPAPSEAKGAVMRGGRRYLG